MGVPGFLKFLWKENKSCFKLVSVNNTTLIMDGTNIMIKLYEIMTAKIRKFGGDYYRYYHFVKSFFINLIKCNITPIVVLDGFSLKEKESIRRERWMKKLKNLKQFNRSEGRDVPLFTPLLLSNVLITVLRELNITHFYSLYEADRDVAIIGKMLNCPILSNDSDFFFYNVQFIPLQEISLEMKEDKTAESGHKYYFEWLVFDRTGFMEEFKVNNDLLLMVPILLGNDFSQEDVFANFLHHFMEDTQVIHRRQQIIKKVLNWMAEVGSFEEASKYICSKIPDNDSMNVEELVNEIAKSFTIDIKELSPYIKINQQACGIEIDESLNESMLPNDHVLSRFPHSVIKAFIKGDIQSFLIKSLYNNMFYSSIQIEDINQPPAHYTTLPIVCGELQIMDRVVAGAPVKYFMFRDRQCPRIVLLYNSENFLPNVNSEIFTAEPETRKKLFFEVVAFGKKEITVVHSIDNSWALFVISVVYWLKNRKRSDLFQSVIPESIALTALANYAESRIGHCDVGRESSAAESGSSFSILLNDIPEEEFSLIANYFREFRSENPEINYSIQIVHGLSVFECCLREVLSLNALLNYPFQRLRIEQFFSGTIAHNLNHFLLSHSFVCKTAMKSTPKVFKFYNFLRKKLIEATINLN